MKRLAIIGSRNYPQPRDVVDFIETLDPQGVVVVTGGWWQSRTGTMIPSRGVDRLAASAARERGITVVLVGADWDRYGKAAGFRRNPTIIDLSDQVAAFWNGQSNGTRHGIEYAEKLGKPITIHRPKESHG